MSDKEVYEINLKKENAVRALVRVRKSLFRTRVGVGLCFVGGYVLGQLWKPNVDIVASGEYFHKYADELEKNDIENKDKLSGLIIRNDNINCETLKTFSNGRISHGKENLIRTFGK